MVVPESRTVPRFSAAREDWDGSSDTAEKLRSFNTILSLSVLTAIFPCRPLFGRYQNVSILDFTEAKDDVGGDDNWSYKTC